MKHYRNFLLGCAACVLAVLPANGAEGMKKGTPKLASATAMAFAPDGVLFIGDGKSGKLVAIQTTDKATMAAAAVNVENLPAAIASLLGTTAEGIVINDMKVHPTSKKVYFSVSRGRGPDAASTIIVVGSDGKPTEMSLTDVMFAEVQLSNSSAGRGGEAITSISFVKDSVIVSGLTTEEWASNLRTIPYPFKASAKGAGVEIYHGAHGKYETKAPVRTFTTVEIDGKTNVLAAYTCTPLVKFPLDEVKDGAKVKGKTVAELGNRNRPLDMISYSKDGKGFLLMANSARGVMKVSLDGIEKIEGITTRINGVAGLKYDSLADWKDVTQLDKLSDTQAVILSGTSLKTVELP
ncbi:MAG: hypothetical protein R3B84_10395 [Zavarzinella sp.]